jgi:quercetin dioxygenase-like cupin family protein
MKAMRILAVGAFMAAGAMTVDILRAQQAEAKRTELQRHDLSMPGREVIQVRVEIPPGSIFPSHTHPGEEIIYVLEGAWEYVIAGKPVKARAGDVLFVPAGAIHSARNVGAGNAVELATYIVEKGKPLLTVEQ